MNYNELITSIRNRPNFFLRNKDILELDAFLRGVSYASFSESQKDDQFRKFKDEWIPSKFEDYTHDWIEAIIKSKDCGDPFDYFFVLWNEFDLSQSNK
jgi:hypothetical protein